MNLDSTHVALSNFRFIALLFALSSSTLLEAAPGVVETFAGALGPGFSGDGGSAALARMSSDGSMAFDSDGNLVLADTFNHRIRRIDAVSGVISTICGDGTPESRGDGGPAIDARVNYPSHLVMDSSGRIIFSETSGNRVRCIDPLTGNIFTVAGTGLAGYTGDGALAVNSTLRSPSAIAVDSLLNIFISDTENFAVRRVDHATGNISTYAGGNGRGFAGDGGPAASALLDYSKGIAVDSEDNIYIGDVGNGRIRKVDSSSGLIDTIAGTGGFGYSGDGIAAVASSLWPYLISFNSNDVLFVSEDERIRTIDLSNGKISTFAGTLRRGTAKVDGKLATLTSLGGPGRVAFDEEGNAYFGNGGIRRVERGGPSPFYRPDLAIGRTTRDTSGLFRYSSNGMNQSVTGDLGTNGTGYYRMIFASRGTAIDRLSFNVIGGSRFVVQLYSHYEPGSGYKGSRGEAMTLNMDPGESRLVRFQVQRRSKIHRTIRSRFTYVLRSTADPSKFDVGRFLLYDPGRRRR